MTQLAIVPSRQAGGDDTHPDARPYFDPTLVVSRDTEGNVLSRYGDPFWSLGAQSSDGTSGANLQFFDLQGVVDGALVARVREQQKALMWLYMDAGKLRAPSNSPGTTHRSSDP